MYILVTYSEMTHNITGIVIYLIDDQPDQKRLHVLSDCEHTLVVNKNSLLLLVQMEIIDVKTR